MKIKLVIIDSAKPRDSVREISYFVPDDVTHIDMWRYSPEENRRVIESRFC